LITAIGPAPATGRDRWLELAAVFKSTPDIGRYKALLDDPAFIAAGSDIRFELAKDLLSSPPGATLHSKAPSQNPRARGKTRYWTPPGGRRTAKITENEQAFILAVDLRAAPGFGNYLLKELDQLYEAYAKTQL
jgi:ParB family chromosome partitioning protein